MKETKENINQRIGVRLRQARKVRGLTQAQLGNALGVSFQQVQKYESGVNSIVPGKLMLMAATLSVPITYFFGVPDTEASDLQPVPRKFLHLIQGLQRIERQDPESFRGICNMVTALAKTKED